MGTGYIELIVGGSMKILRSAAWLALVLGLIGSGVYAREGQPGPVKPAGEADSLITPATYPFSVQSGIALEDMSSGTTQLTHPGSGSETSGLAPIGFIFRFDGTNYTTFRNNSNGVTTLGAPTIFFTFEINSLSSATGDPKIAPFWDALCTAGSGKSHYKTTGTFGNRKLIVEWRDMKITRNGNCDGTGSGVFQMWLFESSGVVQFVYGSGMTAAPNDGGYSIGMQSGAATNFASVTTAAGAVSYTTPNDTQTTAITAGTSYLFSPNTPAAPTGGSVTNLRQTSLRLNWTDNAGSEAGYMVWRSTDNVNFTKIAELLPDAVSFTDSGLNPSTQYFYNVKAIGSEGGFSPGLAFSATTNTPGSVSSTGAGGLWSSPSTWANGLVPDGGDTVTIMSGAAITIDTAALAGNITIGGAGSRAESKGAATEGGAQAVLRFGDTGDYSLTVAGDVTVGTDGTFSAGSGNTAGHLLTVGGDLINNGTLDFSTNNDLAGAGIVFTGNSSNTFGGAGPVTDIRTITLHKGNTNANILELSAANFTVRGSSTETPASGYLFLHEGMFKISGTFSGNHRTFAVPAYTIPQTAGFWLNNPNYTVEAQSGKVGVEGSLRVSAGNYEVGLATSDSLAMASFSSVIVEGGSITVAGALGSDITSLEQVIAVDYRQSGGTVTTCTVGRSASAFQICFDMGISSSSFVSLTGGDIVIQNSRTGSAFLDYRHQANPGVISLTGATVHFGNALSTGGGVYRATGSMPHLAIDTTAGSQTLRLQSVIAVVNKSRDVNIGPGGKLTVEAGAYSMFGNSFVNNGTFEMLPTTSRVDFNDETGQTDITYSGSGVMTGAIGELNVTCRNLILNQVGSNIRVYGITLNGAQLVNASKLTLGNNDTRTSIVTLGTGATFDSAPVFDLGTGGEAISYSGQATTGPEVKPDRNLAGLTYDGQGATLTLTGGDYTVGYLHIIGGQILPGNSTLTMTGVLTRHDGYVNGKLRRRIASATVTYEFPVGVNGYSPVSLAVSSLGTNPSFLSVKPVDAVLPGLSPATAVSRYWKVEEEGDITARASFTYLPADIAGNPANYKLFRSNGSLPMVIPGSTINMQTISTPAGITDFTGDWGVGEQLAPVAISGRVTTSGGAGIRNAIVTLTGSSLPAPVTVQTGPFGSYVFQGLQPGETYTIKASAKRYRFSVISQTVTPMGDLANVDFVANPQE